MKYIVMECHLSYAVVLDEEGRFLKVANRNYEVGQTVTDIIEMQVPQSAAKKTNKWIYSLTAMAACMVLMVASVFQMEQLTYASVYMTINPEVRIDVNRNDMVVGIDGINPDGENLISGYEYKKKDLDLVMDELVDRAIDMGYLHEGGQISLVLDTDSNEWILAHSDTLTTQLNEHLNEKLSVTIEVTNTKEQSNQVVIPVVPEESDYDESDYGETDQTIAPPVSPKPAESDHSDSNYDDNSYDDGQTDYDEPDNMDDGRSDYQEDSQSDYSDDDDFGGDDSDDDDSDDNDSDDDDFDDDDSDDDDSDDDDSDDDDSDDDDSDDNDSDDDDSDDDDSDDDDSDDDN